MELVLDAKRTACHKFLESCRSRPGISTTKTASVRSARPPQGGGHHLYSRIRHATVFASGLGVGEIRFGSVEPQDRVIELPRLARIRRQIVPD